MFICISGLDPFSLPLPPFSFFSLFPFSLRFPSPYPCPSPSPSPLLLLACFPLHLSSFPPYLFTPSSLLPPLPLPFRLSSFSLPLRIFLFACPFPSPSPPPFQGKKRTTNGIKIKMRRIVRKEREIQQSKKSLLRSHQTVPNF